MIIHDGVEYARVSDILKPYTNFEHIDPNILARKAEIGSNVHKAIYDHNCGDLALPCSEGAGYFHSFVMWSKLTGYAFSFMEKRLYWKDKRVTGQIDSLGHITNAKCPVLIDFKTSAQESYTWELQAHLYGMLLETNGVDIEPTYIFLKLDKEGNLPKVFSYKKSQNIISKCLFSIEEYWKKKESEIK